MFSHWMPSAPYSSCSALSVSWMKICCSFSFTKLMHSCSNPFFCLFSVVCEAQATINQRIETRHTTRHTTRSEDATYTEDLKTVDVENTGGEGLGVVDVHGVVDSLDDV